MMDDDRKCNYFMTAGVNMGQRCSDPISFKLDPEKKFCSVHRRCVYPKGIGEKIIVEEPPERFADFITFKVSIVRHYTSK
jgi:hypothetical protein